MAVVLQVPPHKGEYTMFHDYRFDEENVNTGDVNSQKGIATWTPTGHVQPPSKDVCDDVGGLHSSSEILAMSPEPTQKRKRGRPKGVRNKIPTTLSEPPQKRGRGRPKNSKNKPKIPGENCVTPPEPAQKRGRGRPKGRRNKPKIHGEDCAPPFLKYKISNKNNNKIENKEVESLYDSATPFYFIDNTDALHESSHESLHASFHESLPISLHESNTSYLRFIYTKLHQENPSWSIGIHHWRNFKKSLHSYELAVKKQYIILMRNYEITNQLPDYHVFINFLTPMVLDDFKAARSKAFETLSKLGVRAFYVHEPGRESWLHIHSLMIFDRSKNVLRNHIREAFESTGLVYKQDFKVTVKAMNKTEKDFRRLSSYILKFNGKRKYNLHTPLLFLEEISLRKVGQFGKWFAKGKGKIWEEHREKCRKRRELREQTENGHTTSFDEFDGFPCDW